MTSSIKDINRILKMFLLESYDEDINCDVKELSSALNVSTFVGYVLNKKGINDDYFRKTIFKALNKYERLSEVRKQLDSLFKDKIDYIYLKGFTCAKYYKEPYLRYSNDIDVLVKNDINLAKSLLLKEGYKCIVNKPQEMCFEKNNTHIDLHRTFTEENDIFEELFSEAKYSDYELDINYKYLYLLVHCMKHMGFGQFDYKFFVDLFYLRQLIDKSIVTVLLNKYNLVTFDSRVNYYLDVVLGNKEYDDMSRKLEDFILDYALDYGAKNRSLINKKGKTKIGYLLSRIFIPYEKMCYEYPKLEKYKVLLPIYYIDRLFKPFRTKKNKYYYNELSSTLNNNADSINNMNDFINKMGIH